MTATAQPARSDRSERLFPALLKYWRGQRGLSQLDLGLAADVSARHISFLETGRSGPSIEMVLLLGEVLDVPLRDRNEMLRAGGYEATFPEPAVDELLVGPLRDVVDTMLAGHEPFPMIVVDRLYNMVLANTAAMHLSAMFIEPDATDTNMMRLVFGSDASRQRIVNWEEVASNMLRRLQRESLRSPQDEALRALHDEFIASPATPAEWRTLALADAAEPFLTVRLQADHRKELSFLTTITAFNAPQNVTLDEIRIESWFPTDDATRDWCESQA